MKTLRIGVLVVACTLAACSGGSSNSTTTTSGSATTTAPPGSTASVTVTPSTGLTDGQTVHVVATGFAAGAAATATECSAAATALTNCDAGHTQTATADGSGTVTLDFVVHKGPFGSGNVTCTGADACRIGVSAAGGAHARATITFT